MHNFPFWVVDKELGPSGKPKALESKIQRHSVLGVDAKPPKPGSRRKSFPAAMAIQRVFSLNGFAETIGATLICSSFSLGAESCTIY
ncbi:hypothetical protein [Salinibacter altiplanensis]|uniref:hypothetical protein n=1 Tax=Salinibacter altiplanensis TaxID=1803181 RepID=UPI001F3BDABB|nr:hypothetical protein [Salinibacter altiplanensis]